MEDWSKLTVNQLKTECAKRSLDTTGKKADLVQRLKEYVSEEEVNADEAEQVEEEDVEQVEDVVEEEEYEEEGEEGEEEAEDEVIAEGEEEEEQEAEHGEDEGDEEGQEEGAVQDQEEETEEGEEKEAGQEEEKEKEQEAGESVDQVIDAVDSAMEEGEKKEEKEKSDEKADLKKATARPRVPVRKVVRAEYQGEQRIRTVVFGSLTRQDMRNEEMLEFLDQADQFFIRFALDGSTGHAELRMKTPEDAELLVESMTENPFKEGLVIKQLGRDDGHNVDSILKGEPEKGLEKFDVRMLYVNNVPESATEDALKQLLPEALSACIPRDEKKSPKGYAYLEFEDSDKMEACYKSVDTLTLDGYLMTLHHIPSGISEYKKYPPGRQGRPPMNRPSNGSMRGGRRPDQRGNYQQRDRRPDRSPRGRPGYGVGGGNRNRTSNVRPLLGNQPSNWGNRGNQESSGGVDAVNLLVGLSQMLSNQQQAGSGNQNYGGGNRGMGNQGYRQDNYGRQGGSQDQWNRKRQANDGGFGYGKRQRQDNYGGGYNQGGYRGGRRYY